MSNNPRELIFTDTALVDLSVDGISSTNAAVDAIVVVCGIPCLPIRYNRKSWDKPKKCVFLGCADAIVHCNASQRNMLCAIAKYGTVSLVS